MAIDIGEATVTYLNNFQMIEQALLFKSDLRLPYLQIAWYTPRQRLNLGVLLMLFCKQTLRKIRLSNEGAGEKGNRSERSLSHLLMSRRLCFI